MSPVRFWASAPRFIYCFGDLANDAKSLFLWPYRPLRDLAARLLQGQGTSIGTVLFAGMREAKRTIAIDQPFTKSPCQSSKERKTIDWIFFYDLLEILSIYLEQLCGLHTLCRGGINIATDKAGQPKASPGRLTV